MKNTHKEQDLNKIEVLDLSKLSQHCAIYPMQPTR